MKILLHCFIYTDSKQSSGLFTQDTGALALTVVATICWSLYTTTGILLTVLTDVHSYTEFVINFLVLVVEFSHLHLVNAGLLLVATPCSSPGATQGVVFAQRHPDSRCCWIMRMFTLSPSFFFHTSLGILSWGSHYHKCVPLPLSLHFRKLHHWRITSDETRFPLF